MTGCELSLGAGSVPWLSAQRGEQHKGGTKKSGGKVLWSSHFSCTSSSTPKVPCITGLSDCDLYTAGVKKTCLGWDLQSLPGEGIQSILCPQETRRISQRVPHPRPLPLVLVATPSPLGFHSLCLVPLCF